MQRPGASGERRRVRLPVSSPMYDDEILEIDQAAATLQTSRAGFIRDAALKAARKVNKVGGVVVATSRK